MTNDELRQKLYSLYQLDWMMSHGYSLADLIKALDGAWSGVPCIVRKEEPMSVARLYDAVVEDLGFGGECFVCFDEFMQNEYLDCEYIHALCEPLGYSGAALYRQYEEDSKQLISELWHRE